VAPIRARLPELEHVVLVGTGAGAVAATISTRPSSRPA
jgi:hypothetical protein